MNNVRFSANISLLFTEYALLDRFELARRAGFDAVEIQFPYNTPLDLLVRAKEQTGLDIALINLPAGDLMEGGEGLAAVPERTEQFAQALEIGVRYATALQVQSVNVLPGRCHAPQRREEYLETFHQNLKRTADHFHPSGIITTFEAINTFDMPGFLIHNFEQMQATLDAVHHPGLAMQYDIYHMSRMGEPVEQQLLALGECMGHIQFADLPDRGQPGSGTLDFERLFSTIAESNYHGWVGAEYMPQCGTQNSLGWLGNRAS